MSQAERKRTPPSGWVQKWVREEKFWQDVTTRTLSALIVLILGYLFAILAGYIGEPNVWRAGASTVVLVALVAFVATYTRWAVKAWRTGRGAIGPIGPFAVLVSLPFGLAVILLLLMAALSLFQTFLE